MTAGMPKFLFRNGSEWLGCGGLLVMCALFALSAGPACGETSMQFPPPGNSAWVYDTLYHNGESRGRDPGSFAHAINQYNRQARKGHAITRVFPYGGDLEMYCGHKASRCTEQDLKVLFDGDAGGARSVAAYAQRLKSVQGRSVQIVPVLDGSIRGHYQGSLKGFNELSPRLARVFADKVARQMCANPQVDGIQFDLEPFNVRNKNGQYYFYRRIAEDLAGAVGHPGNDPFHCVDSAHPHGRYFSIFGAAHSLAPGTASARHVRDIMTAHHNGFFIAALYDLSSEPPGHLTQPGWYARAAKHEAQLARRGASRLGVPYQLAIPAAASMHEYAGCRGHKCRDPRHARHSQLDYVKAGIQAIRASGALHDPLYLGTAVWCWNRAIVHGGNRYSPARPTSRVLRYLGQHL